MADADMDLIVTPMKGDDKCTLARRIPTPCKTGNDTVDRQRKEEYDDLVGIVDTLVKTPQLRAGCVRHLRQVQAELEEKHRDGNLETFPVVARTLGQFIKQNEVWCVSWLVKLMPTLPAGLQAKAKEFDKDSAPQQM